MPFLYSWVLALNGSCRTGNPSKLFAHLVRLSSWFSSPVYAFPSNLDNLHLSDNNAGCVKFFKLLVSFIVKFLIGGIPRLVVLIMNTLRLTLNKIVLMSTAVQAF